MMSPKTDQKEHVGRDRGRLKPLGLAWLGAVLLAAGLPAAVQKSSGMEEIDRIRVEVMEEATSAATVRSRRSALLRWWRLLWRSGQEMRRFDEVADRLISTDSGSVANWAAVDRGYAILEEMLESPIMIPEVPGRARGPSDAATDWPYYMGPTGRNTGYSPDPGPSEGKIAWKFPKGTAWNAAPVVEEGKVYLSSPGIDVVGFCLDEASGDILWRARQFGEKFYGTPTAKHSPVVSGSRVLIRTGRDREQMRFFDKSTGEALEPAGAGHKTGQQYYSYARGGTHVVVGDAFTGRDFWVRGLKGHLAGEPQMDSARVYTIGESGRLTAFALASGDVVWQARMGEAARGRASVGSRAIYAGGAGTKLHSFNKEDGSLLWTFDTGSPEVRAHKYFSPVLEHGERIYFGTASRDVYCLDASGGRIIWKRRVDDWVRSRPVKIGDTLYVATLGGRLYALQETRDGINERWECGLGVHGIEADLVLGENGILASGRDLILYSVDPGNGSVRWRHGILDGAWKDGEFIRADYTAALPGSPTVVDGVVYIGGPDGFVNAVDAATGEELWKFETGSVITAAVSVVGDTAFFGMIGRAFAGRFDDEAPAYYAVNRKTGEPVWISREYGNVWIGAIERQGVLFLGDMAGNVYGADPASGRKLWQYYTATDTPQEDKPLDYYEHGWPPGVYCLPAADEECFYTGSWSGYYFAFEHPTGRVRWRVQTGFPETGGGLPDSAAPTLHKDHLYVQKNGNLIAAIDVDRGEISWEWKAPEGYLQNGTVAGLGDRIYGSVVRRVVHIPYDSRLYCFSDVESGGGILWSHRDGGGLTAPVITNGQIMFGSSTGMFLTSLNPETGELLWKVFTGGEMTENVPAIYGNMLFSVSKNGWLNAVK